MPHELPIWALSLGFTLFCFVAIVAAGVWEKRRIQTFSIPAAGSERPLTEYGRLTNETLRQLGYAFHGTFHDARGSIYKLRYDFWKSADNLVLCCVTCGTILTQPSKQTSLVSRLEDGHYLETTDMVAASDLSGLMDLQIWPSLSITRLVERHFARLQTLECSPIPFSDSPMGETLTIGLHRAERLVAQGDAQFVDEDRMVWKYTLKGAFRYYLVAIWFQRGRRGLRHFIALWQEGVDRGLRRIGQS